MHKADAGRIAWFLGLQRILRFPRYFMAPAAVLRAVHRLAAHGLDTPSRGQASFQNGAASPERWRHSAPQLLSTHRRATSTIARIGATTLLRQMTGAASASPVDRPSLQSFRDLAPVMIGKQNVQEYTQSVSAPRQPISGVQNKYRRNPSPGDGIFRSLNSPALAPSAAHSAWQISGGVDVDATTEPTTADTGTSLRDRSFPPANERAPSGRHIAGQSNSWSLDRDADDRNVQPQSKRSAVSTIHLDGSALGRWTVQHLERALGKPATGMTGVDPRATPLVAASHRSRRIV
jgi:hypothetical protein